ncbi:MAG TPA: DUF2279 domain-containing protein, partial [Gemmatimonadaceae bacterium]|nr:DUF2279 domain-containing protein [Gemmatimonadaceae bacterium]
MISGSVLALLVGSTAPLGNAFAQDTTGRDLPPAISVTNGIEAAPRGPLPSLPSASCPLTSNQLKAVRAGVGGAFIGGNAYLYHYFKKAWWSGERSDGFFFNADWDMEFRDQDKFGHMLGGYHLTRIGYAGLRASCVSKRKALVASAAYAALFQIQIEIFDARFEKYGFSYPDLLANTAGQVFAVAQQLNPRLKAFKPTFSYRETRALKNRVAASELRPSTDYSGQTYWVSTDVDMLLPDAAKPYWPAFIRLSAGHSITDWITETGTTQRGRRKIVLSLDLDPEKLPGDAPLWKSIKHTLSYYRFPAPALELT